MTSCSPDVERRDRMLTAKGVSYNDDDANSSFNDQEPTAVQAALQGTAEF